MTQDMAQALRHRRITGTDWCVCTDGNNNDDNDTDDKTQAFLPIQSTGTGAAWAGFTPGKTCKASCPTK